MCNPVNFLFAAIPIKVLIIEVDGLVQSRNTKMAVFVFPSRYGVRYI